MLAPARPIQDLIALNTRLFHNGLTGVDDYIARRRTHARANNIAFVALHLVSARFYFGRFLGLAIVDPYEAQMADVETIEQVTSFPPIDHLRDAWNHASDAVLEHIVSMPDARWSETSTVTFPIAGTSRLECATFLLHHESYHLGQLGMLRKQAGLPAMAYG